MFYIFIHAYLYAGSEPTFCQLSIAIRVFKYHTFSLSGPLNHIVSCHLSMESGNQNNVKFGKGWKKFCQLNNIVYGNVLEFTTDAYMSTKVIIVKII
jgi:hypothetical protein